MLESDYSQAIIPATQAIGAEPQIAPALSIVIPVYNEDQAIEQMIAEVREVLSNQREQWEIIVVDDGSTDHTFRSAEQCGVRIIRNPYNLGYGASLKIGMQEARSNLVCIIDGDGSYDPRDIVRLLAFSPCYKQVIGCRQSEKGSVAWLRIPAKVCIRILAQLVAGKSIPDVNSGLRLFDRQIALDYRWALPEGFSCSTSLTLSFLCSGAPVKFIPINYRKRTGRSKFRPIRDTAIFATTIVRVTMYFRPLRIFLPIAILLGTIAFGKGLLDISVLSAGLTDSDIIMSTCALMIAVFGLLADLIVATARYRRLS